MSDTEKDKESSALTVIPQRNLGNTVRASWQFSLHDLRANISRYSPAAKEAIVNAFLWCIDERHPVGKVEFANAVGASDNLIYKIFTGRYADENKNPLEPSPKLVARINEWLNVERQRYKSTDSDFLLTPTAKFIFTSCDLARESHSPVELWGSSQIGKTWALRAYREQHNHGRTIMVELDAVSGLGGLVRALAAACGVSQNANTADLIERVKRALTPDTVVIVDEVHLLKNTYRKESYHACVETLRRIQDKTESGFVLCWTHFDDLRDFKDKELAQLWRRSVHRRACPTMPTKGDLAVILQHYGLPFPAKDLSVDVPKQALAEKPYDILRSLAKSDGLKVITERLRYARKLATKEGVRRVTWWHFVDAHLRIEKQAVPENDWA